MKLYDSPGAPSPRRVRIFLAEKGLTVDKVTLDLRRNEQMSAAFLAINPRGTLPALVLDDGTVLDESSAICRFFEALHPQPPLFGETPGEIAMIDGWTRRIETDGYQAVANVFRNTMPAMKDRAVTGKWPPMPQIPELVERGRVMFDCFVRAVDERLADSEWIASDRYSFADVSLLITMDFARAAGITLPDGLEALARWYQAASARPSASA